MYRNRLAFICHVGRSILRSTAKKVGPALSSGTCEYNAICQDDPTANAAIIGIQPNLGFDGEQPHPVPLESAEHCTSARTGVQATKVLFGTVQKDPVIDHRKGSTVATSTVPQEIVSEEQEPIAGRAAAKDVSVAVVDGLINAQKVRAV